MSMALMVRVMKMKIGNPTRKLVLMKLADNANDKGVCWPSYQDIADHCEMDRRSAMRHINKLVGLGFVKKVHRKKSEKLNSSNLFYLTLDSKKTDSSGDNLSPPPSDNLTLGSDTADTRVVSQDHQGVVSPLSPRTSHSFEPVNEPVIERERTRSQSAISENFQPDESTIFQCQKNKLEPLNETELLEFVLYYQSKGEFRADWQKTYLKWLINQRRNFDKKSSPQNRGYSLDELGEDFINDGELKNGTS